MSSLRVRFAPSPTGYLHIGSVRTALFNYLYAKSEGGTFLLRIEDTDRERSRPEFEDEILKSMEWLGLLWDGDVRRQSRRFDHYRSIADGLVREGKAQVSTDKGGQAVVFKVPQRRIEFHDLVHGVIGFDTSTFEDLVIIKSDGSPTYNFSCVVDDHDMGITHVIRGDDHISNTPKQLLLYQALDFRPPEFAHLPLILGTDGAPLSKRHGAVSLSAYQELGYLPEAVLNYLALLGWSPGSVREIFSLKEMAAEFSLDRVNAKAAFFDLEKLRWVNGEHLRSLTGETYWSRLAYYLRTFGGLSGDAQVGKFQNAGLLYKDRIKNFKEFREQADYFFDEELRYDTGAVDKYWKDGKTRDYLCELFKGLEKLDFKDPSALENGTRGLAQKLGISAGALIHPLRVSLTGRGVSPGLFEVMSALGRERVLARLRHALEHFVEIRERSIG